MLGRFHRPPYFFLFFFIFSGFIIIIIGFDTCECKNPLTETAERAKASRALVINWFRYELALPQVQYEFVPPPPGGGTSL